MQFSVKMYLCLLSTKVMENKAEYYTKILT